MTTIQAIDVHGHYGIYARGDSAHVDRFMSGTAAEVVARARQAHVELTVVSPLRALLPRGRADVVAGNVEAAEVVPQYSSLRQWVVVHPLQEKTFEQASDVLRQDHCIGIKLHPEEHDYKISQRGDRLFSFAADHGAHVLAHTGEPNSMPMAFVPFADRYPEMTLILAHLGNGHDRDPTHQVRAIQASRRDNLYTDTSSQRNLVPGCPNDFGPKTKTQLAGKTLITGGT